MSTGRQRNKGIVGARVADAGLSIGYDMGTSKDGPERGVCTSGRGLIDASKERQLWTS